MLVILFCTAVLGSNRTELLVGVREILLSCVSYVFAMKFQSVLFFYLVSNVTNCEMLEICRELPIFVD